MSAFDPKLTLADQKLMTSGDFPPDVSDAVKVDRITKLLLHITWTRTAQPQRRTPAWHALLPPSRS